MANSIDLVTTFLRLMDEVYKLESVTASMDAMTQTIDFAGEATVKVMKLATVGLGNYSRANGYPKGDITATWEAMTLAAERGRQFSIDKMDNDESLGLVLGTRSGSRRRLRDVLNGRSGFNWAVRCRFHNFNLGWA